MRKGASIACVGLVLLVALSGCSSEPEPVVKLDGEDQILARVNGDPISAYEVQQAANRLVGNAAGSELDAATRKRVLDSLVTSRAMALSVAAEMSAEELAAVDREAAAHREQLLVKRYLQKHAEPQPVSEQMVRDYYQKHADRFGAGETVVYDMLFSQKSVPGNDVSKVTRWLEQARSRDQWSAIAKQAQSDGAPLEFRQGAGDEHLLHQRVQAMIKGLKTGETSQPLFVEGKAYLVRVQKRQVNDPKPLAEVRTQIRRALAPVQLREAVAVEREKLLKTTTVEYLEPELADNR